MEFTHESTFLKARQMESTLDYRAEFADSWAHQGLHIASRLSDRSLVLLDARGDEVLTS